nr:hypothetical protein [Tanacetum cinerariifolium]
MKDECRRKREKVDTVKAFDASLVITESSGTEFEKQDTRSMSRNDADADDVDIKPVYDEEPMAKVQVTADNNVFATRRQHIEQLEFNNEGHVDQNVKQYSGKGFCNCSIKNESRKLTGNSVNTKFAKPSILGKLILHQLRNQSVVRQPTAYKSERPKSSKPRFTSQVDVKNDLPKPFTTHYLPRERESSFAKPHHVIAPSSSRNSSKSVSTSILKETYGSDEMIHNYYLKDARKETQERGRNSRPSVIPSARLQSITNGENRRVEFFKTFGLRWVPTGKIFTSSITKVDGETPNGSNDDINNP